LIKLNITKTEIYKIKRLILEYYELEPSVYIDKNEELLTVLYDPKVCISRRSLKHFVERRKSENLEIVMLHKAIDFIKPTILLHDIVEYFEPNKYIYTKHFYHLNMPSLRVVTEIIDNHLQIKSIHYRVYKKTQPEG
jgi:hypothetical protein